ncbi:hypothetical protein [Actinacidiphila glaucinigra]|uniref:hypothetical protein n=1 Tax=Actinacidiphila glaucinigra TaxID=235986 RepID=UPI003D930995
MRVVVGAVQQSPALARVEFRGRRNVTGRGARGRSDLGRWRRRLVADPRGGAVRGAVPEAGGRSDPAGS